MINALEAILRRPKTVLMLLLALVFGGTLSYITIPKASRRKTQSACWCGPWKRSCAALMA
jgi:hypothetical protein